MVLRKDIESGNFYAEFGDDAKLRFFMFLGWNDTGRPYLEYADGYSTFGGYTDPRGSSLYRASSIDGAAEIPDVYLIDSGQYDGLLPECVAMERFHSRLQK